MVVRFRFRFSRRPMKKISIRSASGRMRRDTLLSPGGLALPPFSLPPFTVSPGAWRDLSYQVYAAVGGGWALCFTEALSAEWSTLHHVFS
eukprot:scaffold5925_cov122-Isochrysis_galbana.AAC.6